MYWSLMAVWFVALMWRTLVYPQRALKGYIGRLMMGMVTRVALRFFSEYSLAALFLLMLTFVMAWCVVIWPIALGIELLCGFTGIDLEGGYVWIACTIQVFDDILNGEDDAWKKRWKAAKNKVKWLWTPPPEPALGRVSS